MEYILGIDFGGTKTAVGLFDLQGSLLDSRTTLNAKSMDANEVFDSVSTPIVELYDKYGDSIVACGLASAGPTRNNGELFSPPNTPAWIDFPFLDRIRSIVGDIVYFENDVNALALAEGLIGAAKNEKNYMSMVVSTGIGGGLVVDGTLLHGHELNAGEVGHIVIDPNGPLCGLGCTGCVESIASGPALEKRFGIKPENATEEMKIFCAENVARMISIVVTTLDIRVVTIGGSVALGFGDLFFQRCQERFDELWQVVHNDDVRIIPSSLGAQGGLFGACAVGMDAYKRFARV